MRADFQRAPRSRPLADYFFLRSEAVIGFHVGILRSQTVDQAIILKPFLIVAASISQISIMPARTRASYEEGEENLSAAVPPPPRRPPPPPPRPPSRNSQAPIREEVQEDEQDEEWINPNNAEEDEEDDELILINGNVEPEPRPTWILQVEIPEIDDDGNMAHVFIDPGMTATRLGRCILQVAAPTSAYNFDDIASNERSNLAGLFGKDDSVFYSLEFILAMDPVDGANRIFCVSKPDRRKMDENGDSDWTSMIATYMTYNNVLAATAVLFLAILWNTFAYSILLMIPEDLPSLWRTVSYILDWPAREVYRYGPSIVGWEGRDMIDICTQMNRRYYFVGLGRNGHDYEDREYWRQNPHACETIYRMKEESFARMCRPIWYLVVLVASFFALQRLVEKIFRPSGPPLNRSDRAVLDMYRNLQILSREQRRYDDRRDY